MRKVPVKHSGCDAWAIYEKQFIDADNAKNMHIVEGNITLDDRFSPNTKHETLCGRRLKGSIRRVLFHSKVPSEMRSRCATLQNNENEVCGRCVSHFYADPDQP